MPNTLVRTARAASFAATRAAPLAGIKSPVKNRNPKKTRVDEGSSAFLPALKANGGGAFQKAERAFLARSLAALSASRASMASMLSMK